MLKGLKGIEIDFYTTDGWKDFAKLLPYFKHLIGKKHTKGIEGRNSVKIWSATSCSGNMVGCLFSSEHKTVNLH
ncbi:MAG: hypothetical protein OHK0045_19010 [Raineya sp.]